MIKNSDNFIWIIGEGGLLGSALRSRSECHRDTFQLWTPSQSFHWNRPENLGHEFRGKIQLFKNNLSPGQRWTIIWAAGAGVIGTSDADLKQETENFKLFLGELEKQFAENLKEGTFFLTSSAGGIWAGSPTFPVMEDTPPCPISDYGQQKLRQEEILHRFSVQHPEFRVLIGRVSNLYGPGQNLFKPQGLLSQLCRSALLRVPLTVFVPLDTVRDYISNEDCAELIFRTLKKHLCAADAPNYLVKIFASEEAVSIRTILNYLSRLTKRPPTIICPPLPVSNQQPRELSFQSKIYPDPYPCKPLVEGLKQVLEHQEFLLQVGELPYPKTN